MSCSLCYGHPNCPSCSVEPIMITCTECKGSRKIYFDDDGKDLSKEQYDKLPEDERGCDDCEKCDENGEIEEEEYEPDYDDYDE